MSGTVASARRSIAPILMGILAISALVTGLTPSGSEAQQSTITFAAIGDFGADSASHTAVADMVDSWNPDFLITVGDNRYSEANYDPVIGRRYCHYLTGVAAGPNCAGGSSDVNRFFPALGNHDYNDGNGLGDYLDYFTLPGNERNYDFVRGPVHFFVVDSGRWGSVEQAQIDWLRSGLQTSTSQWQIVYFHHAPYSSAEHGSNSRLQLDYADWGADAVLAGHDHHYERIERDGIVYFVNGLGGRSIYGLSDPIPGSAVRYNANYGAMRITAGPHELRFEFRAIDGGQGSLIDSRTLIGDGSPGPTTTGTTTTIPVPTTVGGGGGVDDVAIAAWNDDVEQPAADSAVYFDSSDIELVDDSSYKGHQQVGLRFRGVGVPAGATITASWLQFVADESDSSPTDLVIAARDLGNAGPFAPDGGVANGPMTDASTSWSAVEPWRQGTSYRTPDLSSVVQEVVDRSDWRAGNSLAFIVTGSGERTAESYDGNRADAPRLHLEYTTGAPPATTSTTAPPPSTTPSPPSTTASPPSTTLSPPSTTVPATTGPSTTGQPSTTVQPPQRVEAAIVAWDDDVEEGLDQPAVYFSSSDLELVDDSYYKGPQLVGLRFAGVAIPSGAAISSATVRFVADESDSVATNLVVRGHDVGNAGRFGLSGGVSTLVATDAAVSWNTVEPWTRGGVYHSPDLAAVVQEIVDRADWRSGNALTLIVSGTGERTAESYDGDRASAPVLEVEYRR